jgi:hypothetical protein
MPATLRSSTVEQLALGALPCRIDGLAVGQREGHAAQDGPRTLCEHAFVSPERSPYIRFRRSVETRDLAAVLSAAAEVPWLNLDDALEILTLMAQEADPRFDKAAAR